MTTAVGIDTETELSHQGAASGVRKAGHGSAGSWPEATFEPPLIPGTPHSIQSAKR